MSYPPDILLPVIWVANSYVLRKFPINSNREVSWSFDYDFSQNMSQTGYSTFITTLTSPAPDALPGHYLVTALSSAQTTVQILSNNEVKTVNPFHIFNIAFDTNGYFALSSNLRPGVSWSEKKANSLIIRDIIGNVIFNSQVLNLTPLYGAFFTTGKIKTLKLTYNNNLQYIDIKFKLPDTSFLPLTTINLNYKILNPSNKNNLYVGIAYATPLSSESNLTAARMRLYNFTINHSISSEPEIIEPTLLT